MLWPPHGHGCGVDDSGWPWMIVVCAFFVAVGGVGKGGRWWWWLRLQAGVGLVVIFCCDCGGSHGGSFVVNVAYGRYCV